MIYFENKKVGVYAFSNKKKNNHRTSYSKIILDIFNVWGYRLLFYLLINAHNLMKWDGKRTIYMRMRVREGTERRNSYDL